MLAVALLLTGLASGAQRGAGRESFEEAVLATEQAVDRRMHTYYVDAMLDGRGLFAASSSVTREVWSGYVAGSELERRYPGIRAIEITIALANIGLGPQPRHRLSGVLGEILTQRHGPDRRQAPPPARPRTGGPCVRNARRASGPREPPSP